MITFEQFKKDWREKELREGTKQHVVNGNIVPIDPLTDEEILKLYNAQQNESKTGVDHHGEIIGGGPVLTLKGVGH